MKIDRDLLVKLKQRYLPPLAPKCRVCRGTMKVGSMGPGHTIWHCASKGAGTIGKVFGTKEYIEGQSHWVASEYIQINCGDPDVLELIKQIEE